MTTAQDGPRRARWMGIAMLLATFFVGMLAGAATVRVVAAREPNAQPAAADSTSHRHFLDQLGLTPDQRRAADAILERRHKQVDAFWKQNGPELRAIVDSTRAEIRAILTPVQRALADSIHAQRQRASGAREGDHTHDNDQDHPR
jgi:Spy/CpxP family protein refolding chaperone